MFLQARQGGVSYFRFEELCRIPRFDFAVLPRVQGGDGWRALSVMGIDEREFVSMQQVHGNETKVVDAPLPYSPACDGLILTGRKLWGCVRTADCLPVVAVDPLEGICALFHAGWRGSARRVVREGLLRLGELSGGALERLLVAFGPCIRKCCYRVGPEVFLSFEQSGHPLERIRQGAQLDLIEANRFQLEGLGIQHILDSGICTHCCPDFPSFRRDGTTQRTWTICRSWDP